MKLITKLKNIWIIALPIVIQGIVFQLQSLTDKAFLGNLDTKYISALGAAQFPYNTTMDTVVALGIGLVVYTARFVGAKKRDKVNNYALSSMFYGSVISTLLFLAWFFCTEEILRLLNVDAGILQESALYIRICSGALLLLGIDSALQAMLQGIGNTKPIMVCGVMKVLLNIVISYVLVFGRFGFEAMNIKGAAIGTLLANLISSVSLIVYCFVCKRKEYYLFDDLNRCLDFKSYLATVKIGLPTAMEYFLWNASNLVLIAFLNSLSYKATAVYTLTFGIEVVVYAVFNGTGKSAMTLIGQGIGASDYKTADSYLKICMFVNAILVAVSGTIFAIFTKELLGVFTKDAGLMEMAGPYLIFTAAIMFPKSMNVIIGNGIRAYGDTKWMLYSQMIGSVFVVSCSLVLVKFADMGIAAIYITLLADECLRAIINTIRYRGTYSPQVLNTSKIKLQGI